ncbi:MAG TPA: cation transporter, partial [Spirochaetia bacterium]|nr:cation transporter [Spirochaetia bacterium]
MKTDTVAVGGMTCASCAAAVERSLRKLDGVNEASVNLATEKATVTYDQARVKAIDIREAIRKAGYTPIEKSEPLDTEAERKEREVRSLKVRFFVSLAFAVPLLYLAMAPMIGGGRFPLPPRLKPMDFPLAYALTEMLLLIPILVAGRRFYTSGFRAIIHRSPNMDSLIAVGTSAAILYSLFSVYQILRGDMDASSRLYFETAGVIITLILLGKFLESASKRKTSQAIKKLLALAPKTATVIYDDREVIVPISDVEQGDLIRVKPGEKIPVDGVVEEGITSVDES